MLDEKKLQEVADHVQKDPGAPDISVHGMVEEESRHEDLIAFAAAIFALIAMAWLAYTS